MIIGFAGNRGAGKDTAGAYLIKQYGFERRAFADPLKRSIASLFDIPFWEVDKYKLEDNAYVTLTYKDEEVGWAPVVALPMFDFLARYANEAHKDALGDLNFWVNQTLPVGGFYAGRKIVLTDVRFDEEVERIHLLGGIVVNVKRESATFDKSPHRRWRDDKLDVDCTIENNTNIDDFYSQLDNFLSTYPAQKAV
jgi:hypothetical protein